MSSKVRKLCIIGDINCSTTRTYVEYLSANNITIDQIWIIRFCEKEKNLRLIPKFKNNRVVDRLGSILQRKKCIKPVIKKNFSDICEYIQKQAKVDVIDYSKDWNPFDYARNVVYFKAVDINDQRITDRIKRNKSHVFLYTNGGIVNAKTLGINQLRMLHIHPGKVPEWRGSDCFIWSAAIRNKLGYSCFYMSTGIDEGDLICTEDYDIPLIDNLKELITENGEEIIYNAIMYGLDPHYRARLLCKVLVANKGKDWSNIKTHKQNESNEAPYLWIHPRLRERLLLRLGR